MSRISNFDMIEDAKRQKRIDKTDKTDIQGNITNNDFLRAIFGNNDSKNKVLVSRIAGKLGESPFERGAKAEPWNPNRNKLIPGYNNYFTVAVFRPNGNGGYNRQKQHFHSLYAIMLDDLGYDKDGENGAKVDIEKLQLPFSWLIETSPDNYQAGYMLEEPISDPELADKLMKAIIAKGLCDSGANGVSARFARLPVAVNTKSKKAFQCKLEQWNPDKKYSVDELVKGLELELDPTSEKINSESKGNIVIDELIAQGLYKRKGRENHEIRCPWADEHSDGNDLAYYYAPTPNYPIGGFKCFHSHGEQLNIHDLIKFLKLDQSDLEDKPVILVKSGRMHNIVNKAEEILAQTGSYYSANGMICKIIDDPIQKEARLLR